MYWVTLAYDKLDCSYRSATNTRVLGYVEWLLLLTFLCCIFSCSEYMWLCCCFTICGEYFNTHAHPSPQESCGSEPDGPNSWWQNRVQALSFHLCFPPLGAWPRGLTKFHIFYHSIQFTAIQNNNHHSNFFLSDDNSHSLLVWYTMPALIIHTSCPKTLYIIDLYALTYHCSTRSNLHLAAQCFYMPYKTSGINSL